MTRSAGGDPKFEELKRDIHRQEASLRSRFLDAPYPSQEMIDSIKARLAEELRSTQHRRPRLSIRRLALAAALALAAGGVLLLRTLNEPNRTAPAAQQAFTIETFTASLPSVMWEGDSELDELAGELQDLERRTGMLEDPDNQATESHGQDRAPATSRLLTAAPTGGARIGPAAERMGWMIGLRPSEDL